MSQGNILSLAMDQEQHTCIWYEISIHGISLIRIQEIQSTLPMILFHVFNED